MLPDLGDGAAARDEDGGGGGPYVLLYAMICIEHDMDMNMYGNDVWFMR